MFNATRKHLLRLLRIPPTPEAPWGAPESVRVYRPGTNFYKLRLFHWSAGQALTLVGILFWIIMLGRWERDFDAVRSRATPSSAVVSAPAPPLPAVTPPINHSAQPSEAGTAKAPRRRSTGRDLATRAPEWIFPFLRIVELIGLLGYIVQIPITYALLRLDYELRWYIVTDRSLRIRQGLWRVQESTMSFANLQQVAVTQGPLQRWLKLADVRVQSAGGGGGGEDSARGRTENLHTGIFHGVADASEIRDLILERLRRFRATGLGDPDESRDVPEAPDSIALSDPTLAAAKALRNEAHALRLTLG
jgi:hypothetical protein